MQIVRVQDGTVSKAHTLSIPRRDTWDEVVAAILRNPNIKANSPYIDIIIFEFARMDVPLVSFLLDVNISHFVVVLV